MRLVASDLDGTIVLPDFSMTPRTLRALDECVASGVRVVFVTGRPPRWVFPLAEQTGHRGIAVCANGAAVLDLAAGAVLRTHPLAAATVLEVAERLRAVLPGAAFALETLDGYRREPGFVPRHDAALAGEAGTLEELLAVGPTVIKVLCRQDAVPAHQRSDADGMLAAAREVLAGIAEPVHSNQADPLLEIAAAGVSKASTLAELAADWGIDAVDVVAFGDMPNDVPMLAWAGRGYAMADGHPEAVAAAGDTAPPCAQDGVAQVLEGLLGQLGELRAGRPR